MSFKIYLQDLGLGEDTIRVYTSTARSLQKYQKTRDLTTGTAVKNYLRKRIIKGRGYHVLYAIKHYLKYKKVNRDLIEKLPKPKRSDPEVDVGTYVTRKQLNQILHVLQDNNIKKYFVIATIQAYCGTRPSETIKLNKKNFEYDSKTRQLKITVLGKGRRKGVTVLHPPLSYKVVYPYIIKQGEHPFLTKTFNNIESSEALKAVKYVYKEYYLHIKKASESIGVKNFKPHDFRRNLANDLINSGSNINDIQQVLRHKDASTTLLYFKKDTTKIGETLSGLYEIK